MKNRLWKKIISCVLVLIMVLSVFPANMMQADAATKPVLSISKTTLTKGMTQTLKVKKAGSDATVKWSSANKKVATVTNKGVIKGVNDGTTTIKCVVSSGGKKTSLKCKVTVMTPKFTEKRYLVCEGESITAELLNKYTKASYTWSSADEKVATVNKKGIITGAQTGETTVSVKISIPKMGTRAAKVITRNVAVTVGKSVNVTNQEELGQALSDKDTLKIIIKTDEKATLNIPQGDYSNIEMIVDAPNADVVNNGLFKQITINRIATDTWTENADGNVLILDAAAGHIVIGENAKIKEIRIINVNSNFKIDVRGKVEKVVVNSQSNVTLDVSGTVGEVEINSKSTVTAKGTSQQEIKVIVAENADGVTLNSSVKLDISAGSDTEINLSKGAEGTAVQTTNENKSVEVTNNTAAKVEVTNEAGSSQTVEAGKNATVDGKGNVTNSTTDSGSSAGGGGASSGGGGGAAAGGGGSSASGDASSSGNLTRTVTSFKAIDAVEAGIYDKTTLKSVEELEELFPATVVGISTRGNVKFNVISWTNSDEYDPATAQPGYYKFTAVLGEANKTYTMQSGVECTLNVWVRPEKSISYTTYTDEDLQKFELVSEDTVDSKLVLNLKYSGEKYVYADVNVYFYDASGELISKSAESSYNAEYFDSGATNMLVFNMPTDGSDASGDAEGDANYSAYTILIEAHDRSDNYLSVKDKISIGEPALVTYREPTQYNSKGEYGCNFTIDYSGVTQASGDFYICYWKNGKLIGISNKYYYNSNNNGITNGTTTINKRYFYSDIAPDSVTVVFNYAYIENDNLKQTGEDKSISYNEYTDEDLQKFELVSEYTTDSKLVLNLKYSGEKYVWAEVNVYFYDASGELISKSNESYYSGEYFESGATNMLTFNMPTDGSDASGDVGGTVSYSAYTILIDAYDRSDTYLSVKNKISIGEPTLVTYREPTQYNSKGEYGCNFTIDYSGVTQAAGDFYICYWKDGKLIGISKKHYYNFNNNGITNGTTTVNERYFYSDTEPDSVTVVFNYAYIENDNLKQTGEDKSISYSKYIAEDLQKFELVSEDTVDSKLVLNLKYSGEKYVWADVNVYFYDASGELISKSAEANYNIGSFDSGATNMLVFNMPKDGTDASGDAEGTANYSAYTILISAYDRSDTYLSVKNKISIGEPALVTYSDPGQYNSKGEYGCNFTINYSGVTQAAGDFYICYWKNGKLIGISNKHYYNSKNSVILNGTTTINERYFCCDTAPDSVTVVFNYAYIDAQ